MESNKETIELEFWAREDQGKRPYMEDCYTIKEKDHLAFFAVADGLGGHQNGAVAARLAMKFPRNDNHPDKDFIPNLQGIVVDGLAEQQHDEGLTTFACLVVDKKKTIAYVYSVGDSTILRIRENEVFQMNRRHGIGNTVFSCLGKTRWGRSNFNDYDCAIPELRKGDLFLIATDGVADYIDTKSLYRKNIDEIMQEAAKTSRDNMTAILVKIL